MSLVITTFYSYLLFWLNIISDLLHCRKPCWPIIVYFLHFHHANVLRTYWDNVLPNVHVYIREIANFHSIQPTYLKLYYCCSIIYTSEYFMQIQKTCHRPWKITNQDIHGSGHKSTRRKQHPDQLMNWSTAMYI